MDVLVSQILLYYYRVIRGRLLLTLLFSIITSANCSRAKTLELLEPPGASWSLLAVLAEPGRNLAGTERDCQDASM